LPGTLTEVNALARLAPVAPTALTKSDATAARLKQLLPTMRYAHLATHGEFQADGLGAEK
jgi:CHAT domain-containing protein